MSGEEQLRTLYWKEGKLYLLDQRLLPGKTHCLACASAAEVAEAIREMAVRGAPAIGVSAAFGIALEARRLASAKAGAEQVRHELGEAARMLLQARPTAVNLAWAVERMERRLSEAAEAAPPELAALLEKEACKIMAEDRETNRLIGEHGAALVPEKASILTHCNAGALATAGFGTALGVIRAAFKQGKAIHVYADETRPLLQGARLTALELLREEIPATLVTDSCAGFLMATGKVDLVVVGADRIAANGDTANKIGTYNLAVLCRHHGLPFYVAAPFSTFDRRIASGAEIVIEERNPAEVTCLNGLRLAPEGVEAYNPAFDLTPAELVTAFITERGVIRPPFAAGILKAAGGV